MSWEVSWKKEVELDGYVTETSDSAIRDTHSEAQDLAEVLEGDPGVYDVRISEV